MQANSLIHCYGTRHQLPNFKADFEQFAPDVILGIVLYPKAQDVVQAVAAVLSAWLQLVVELSTVTLLLGKFSIVVARAWVTE